MKLDVGLVGNSKAERYLLDQFQKLVTEPNGEKLVVKALKAYSTHRRDARKVYAGMASEPNLCWHMLKLHLEFCIAMVTADTRLPPVVLSLVKNCMYAETRRLQHQLNIPGHTGGKGQAA
jgi:hypothetical protein